MPRARNPNRDKARELWINKKPISIKEIALHLGETENTIRKWKSLDEWEPKKRNTSKKAPKKRGAPKGNKNAVGKKSGAPKGNKNAIVHGGYSSIFWDTLDDEERACIEDMPQDEEILLIDQIKILTIRERRLLQAINYFRTLKTEDGNPKLQVTTSINTVKENKVFNSPENKKRYEELAKEKIDEGAISYLYDKVSVSQATESVYSSIQRLERELSTVQNSKTKAIEALHRCRLTPATNGSAKDNEEDNNLFQIIADSTKGLGEKDEI